MTLWRPTRLRIVLPLLCALARGDGDEAHVWRDRTWPLRALTEEQYAFWEANGYLVVPGAVPPDLTRAAAAAIREFVGADDADNSTWYAHTRDIYAEREPDGVTKPLHGSLYELMPA